MESHPVPQNITSFEFKLIGDMTLKQFAYLAFGLTTAYLTFVFIFPQNPIIAIPIIGLSSLLGASFAFIPIADRPLDHWVKAYFKAVYSPTKRLWLNPKIKIAADDPFFQNRLENYLHKQGFPPVVSSSQTPKVNPAFTISRIKSEPLKTSAPAPSSSTPQNQQQQKPILVPTTEEKLAELVKLAKDAQLLQTKTIELNRQIASSPSGRQAVETEKLKQYHEGLNIISGQLERLSGQIEEENKKSGLTQPQVEPKVTPQQTAPDPTTKKQTVPTLTSSPNIINGIVTDAQGNYAEGVIVIIHNKGGLPVRAIKTNKLGQFTGATPLPPGEYTVTMEKETLEFNPITTILNNTVLPPIQIRAQKGGLPHA